ncbi:MAG: outer membrane protein assembly factor BamB [Ostreibacterium sp.]
MKIKKITLNTLLCVALIILATGCTEFFLGKENLLQPVDLPSNPKIVQFNRVWQKSIGDGTNEKNLNLRPVVVGERVFAVSSDGVLEALEVLTGKRVWKQEIRHTITAGVSADANLVVVGSDNGLLMAFDANSGQPGWTYQMNTEVLSPPTVVAGLVIARAIDGEVTAIDARSGQVIWKQYIDVADLSVRGNSGGVYLDGMILLTNGKGRLSVLSIKDGTPIFSLPLVRGKGMGRINRITDLLATPVVRNGALFVSAYRQKTLAINLRDGSLLWESPYATSEDLFADGDFVYLIDKNSVIHALDIGDGRLQWTKDTLTGRHISPLTGNGRWTATVDDEGKMSIFDSRDGQYLGYTSVGGKRAYVAPQMTEEGVLTYTSDGRLTLTNVSQ